MIDSELMSEPTPPVPGQKDSVWGNLIKRKVPHTLVMYLGVCFGLFQVTQWLVRRFYLSPHWEAIFLLVAFLLIPSIFVISYFHDDTRHKKSRLRQITVPANVFVLIAVLLVGFGGKDLGRIADKVSGEDAQGERIERIVPKSEFRKRVATFFLKGSESDDADSWLGQGAAFLLERDLSQDPFLSLGNTFSFAQQLRDEGFGSGVDIPLPVMAKIATDASFQYFITGQATKSSDIYTIRVDVFDAQRGSQLFTRSSSSEDLFECVDEITVGLKEDLGIPRSHIERTKDLPVREITTASVPALSHMIKSMQLFQLENQLIPALDETQQAINLDETFAYARYYSFILSSFQGDMQGALGKLMDVTRYDYRLTDREKFIVGANQYFLQGNLEKTTQIAEQWTKLYPEDTQALQLLAQIHSFSDDIEAVAEVQKKILELDPNENQLYIQLANAYVRLGRYDDALDAIDRFSERVPGNTDASLQRAQVLKLLRRFEDVEKMYADVLLLDPQNIPAIVGLSDLHQRKGLYSEAIESLSSALQINGLPVQRRAQLYQARSQVYVAQAQYENAVADVDSATELLLESAPEFQVYSSLADRVTMYAYAGQTERGLEILDKMESLVMDEANYSTINYHAAKMAWSLAERNATAARSSLESVKEIAREFGLEAVVKSLREPEARLLELEGSTAEALSLMEEYRADNPSRTASKRQLGRLYRKNGDYRKGISVLEDRLLDYTADAVAMLELALTHESAGNAAESRELVDKVKQIWANGSPSYYRMVELAELERRLAS